MNSSIENREKRIWERDGIVAQPSPHEDSPFLTFGIDGTVQPYRDIVPVLRVRDPNGNDPKERYTVNDVKGLSRHLSKEESSSTYLMGVATFMSRIPPPGSDERPATKFRDENIKNIEKFLVKVRHVWTPGIGDEESGIRRPELGHIMVLAAESAKHGLMPHAIMPSLDRRGKRDGWWLCYNFTRPISGRPWSNVLLYRLMYHIFKNLPFMKGPNNLQGIKFYIEIPSMVSNVLVPVPGTRDASGEEIWSYHLTEKFRQNAPTRINPNDLLVRMMSLLTDEELENAARKSGWLSDENVRWNRIKNSDLPFRPLRELRFLPRLFRFRDDMHIMRQTCKFSPPFHISERYPFYRKWADHAFHALPVALKKWREENPLSMKWWKRGQDPLVRLAPMMIRLLAIAGLKSARSEDEVLAVAEDLNRTCFNNRLSRQLMEDIIHSELSVNLEWTNDPILPSPIVRHHMMCKDGWLEWLKSSLDGYIKQNKNSRVADIYEYVTRLMRQYSKRPYSVHQIKTDTSSVNAKRQKSIEKFLHGMVYLLTTRKWKDLVVDNRSLAENMVMGGVTAKLNKSALARRMGLDRKTVRSLLGDSDDIHVVRIEKHKNDPFNRLVAVKSTVAFTFNFNAEKVLKKQIKDGLLGDVPYQSGYSRLSRDAGKARDMVERTLTEKSRSVIFNIARTVKKRFSGKVLKYLVEIFHLYTEQDQRRVANMDIKVKINVITDYFRRFATRIRITFTIDETIAPHLRPRKKDDRTKRNKQRTWIHYSNPATRQLVPAREPPPF